MVTLTNDQANKIQHALAAMSYRANPYEQEMIKQAMLEMSKAIEARKKYVVDVEKE